VVNDINRLNENAIRMVQGATKPITQKKKAKSVKEFVEYLQAKHRSKFTMFDILNYLGDRFDTKGFDYGATKSHIITTIKDATGINLVDDILMKNSALSAKRRKPKLPKYDEMWKLEVMWPIMEQDFWKDKISIKLRTRAVTLIRMSVAARNNDATHIHRPSIKWSDESVAFRYFSWKTERYSDMRFSRWMHVRCLPEKHKNICPYRALKTYMAYVEDRYIGADHNFVWLHYRTVTPVAKGTLASDTRNLMSLAGIDKMFGAGSIRHAVITFWRRNGKSYETVMDRTGHRSKRLVQLFYDLSDIEDDITAKILMDGESSEEEMEEEDDASVSSHDEGEHP
jgi:hypothetical protein